MALGAMRLLVKEAMEVKLLVTVRLGNGLREVGQTTTSAMGYYCWTSLGFSIFRAHTVNKRHITNLHSQLVRTEGSRSRQ